MKEIRLLVKEIKEYIDNYICKIMTVQEVADTFGLHRNILNEWFQIIYACSPKQYILEQKLKFLRNLISQHGHQKAYFYAYKLGYSSSGSFCSFVHSFLFTLGIPFKL